MALGSTHPFLKISTRDVPGGKGGRYVRLRTYHHIVPMSRNLGTLTLLDPSGPAWPVMGVLLLMDATKPVFKCGCSEENPDEQWYSAIWTRVTKTVFVWLDTLTFVVLLYFNVGVEKNGVVNILDVGSGPNTVHAVKERNMERISFIHSIDMCRTRLFMAVLRSFFHF
jgi:hypothetical protein